MPAGQRAGFHRGVGARAGGGVAGADAGQGPGRGRGGCARRWAGEAVGREEVRRCERRERQQGGEGLQWSLDVRSPVRIGSHTAVAGGVPKGLPSGLAGTAARQESRPASCWEAAGTRVARRLPRKPATRPSACDAASPLGNPRTSEVVVNGHAHKLPLGVGTSGTGPQSSGCRNDITRLGGVVRAWAAAQAVARDRMAACSGRQHSLSVRRCASHGMRGKHGNEAVGTSRIGIACKRRASLLGLLAWRHRLSSRMPSFRECAMFAVWAWAPRPLPLARRASCTLLPLPHPRVPGSKLALRRGGWRKRSQDGCVGMGCLVVGSQLGSPALRTSVGLGTALSDYGSHSWRAVGGVVIRSACWRAVSCERSSEAQHRSTFICCCCAWWPCSLAKVGVRRW
jgi:hypothetical protein